MNHFNTMNTLVETEPYHYHTNTKVSTYHLDVQYLRNIKSMMLLDVSNFSDDARIVTFFNSKEIDKHTE